MNHKGYFQPVATPTNNRPCKCFQLGIREMGLRKEHQETRVTMCQNMKPDFTTMAVHYLHLVLGMFSLGFQRFSDILPTITMFSFIFRALKIIPDTFIPLVKIPLTPR